jgi:hypothetical protein
MLDPPASGSPAPAPAAAETSTDRRRARLNVTALLAVLALVDVVLARAVGRLMLPNAAWSPATNGALATAGRLTTNFAGALAFFVFATVLVRALTRSALFPRPLRLSLLVVAVVFMDARTAQAFLSGFACVIAWRAPAPGRTKTVVTLFAAPVALGTLALFCDRIGWSPGHVEPIDLLRGGELFALVAAAASPALVIRDRERPPAAGLVAPMVALLAATAVVAAVVLKPALVGAVALHAFRLEVPPPSSPLALLQLALVVVATLGVILAVLLGLAGSPPARLVAYGLVLIVAGGYQPANATQILLSVTGLFALAIAARTEPAEAR